MKKIIDYSWLQLSDLHIYDNTEWKIMQSAIERLPNIDSVKFVIVTGDLHQYGDDYSKTMTFLNNLLDMLHLTKKDIFIVPGNHDSASCEDKEAYTLYIDEKIGTYQDCYRKYFVKNKLIDCFKDYNSFITDFYADIVPQMYPEPEQVSVINWNNKINIVNLNTAIICDGNNEKKQIVDIYKLSDLKSQIDDSCPSIMIAHHAFEWLWENHKNALTRFITDWKISAYLCGDLHKQFKSDIPTFNKSGSNIPCIVCGKTATEDGDTYSDFGCIIYNKAYDSNKIVVNPYIWNDKFKTYQPFHGMESDDGKFSFDLLYNKTINSDVGSSMCKKEEKVIESIWLPDAETANRKQARFGTFTSTKLIEQFIANDSDIWGLTAVKGIGKTFVLQIKKAKLDKEATICLPIGEKADKTNNWGIDDIIFDYYTDLSSLKEYRYIVLLWKYSLLVYTVNQIINISHNENFPWWNGVCPERELQNGLRDLYNNREMTDETYSLCTDENYSELDIIVKQIISINNWHVILEKDLSVLLKMRRKLNIVLKLLNRENISIFIDKIDQSVLQVNAEPPANCVDCYKESYVQRCNNENKSEDFCRSVDAICKGNCCYGCENYATIYSSNALRRYEENSDYKHINLWQHFQLALVQAVSEIRVEYSNMIKVYFTIRQEALACEDWLFSDNRKKVISIVKELWYTKEEQKKIFYDCIKNQEPELLYDADLKREPGRIEECFVGVDTLCHPYAAHLSESVFESIYRHSFDRTRDLQEYGQMLTENMEKIRNCDTTLERGELVKRLIEKMAAKLAFSKEDSINSVNGSYYHEKVKLLPNHWANPNNFEKLIMMFDKNLLFCNEAKSICRRYNRIKRCRSKCDNCEAKYHPISMLYKLGMLGQVHINASNKGAAEQIFLHSKEITYIRGKSLLNINSQSIYILHPALTKSIELLKNKHINHFTGFILGKECEIPREKLETLMSDYNKMDKKAFNLKYYNVFND